MNETAGRSGGDDFGHDLRELFPEMAGQGIDPDTYASAIIVRALNDGSPRLQQRVVDHYGLALVRRVARERVHRLSNPAYRAWRLELGLPKREAVVEFAQSLWRR